MAERHREGYEAVFGPLPSLDGFPAQGQPGEGPWQALSPSQQETINRIFANTGKALEAYQRQLVCADTKFDRVMAGEAQFTEPEAEGARHFVGSGKCAACHSGINFSDSGFHRVPIPGLGADDLGRAEGVASLLENIFNSAGDFSDDAGAGADILAEVDFDPSDRGAFKTPTLRGVAQRRTFGHLGSVRTLEGWLEEVYMRRGRGGQRGGAGGDGFAPELDGIRFNPRAMAAFLRTLNCAPLPAALTQPPGQD
jgi:cytochrome c peroxidase